MHRNIATLAIAAALGLISQGACAVNSSAPPPGDCRVTGAERLPAESGGADALCSAIRAAASSRAPGVRFTVDVEVRSPSMLVARLRLADGRTLPEQRHAVMDRTLTRGSLQRFADALAAELAKSGSS